MLLPLIDQMGRKNQLRDNLIGVVVDNKDPKGLGRVKMKVQTIYESQNIEDLPWVYPKKSTDSGGRGNISGANVPEINSTLMVSWPTGDVYYPQYDGVPPTPQSSQSLFSKNPVPEAPEPELHRGQTQEEGNKPFNMIGNIFTSLPQAGQKFLSWFRFDKNQSVIEFFQGSGKGKNGSPGGSLFRQDRAGNTQMNIPGNLDIIVHGVTSFDFKNNFQQRVGGQALTAVAGADTKRVGGHYTRAVYGDHDTEVAGNSGMKSEGQHGRVASKIMDNSGYSPGTVQTAESGHTQSLEKLDQRVASLNEKLESLQEQHDSMVESGDSENKRLAEMSNKMTGSNIG